MFKSHTISYVNTKMKSYLFFIGHNTQYLNHLPVLEVLKPI